MLKKLRIKFIALNMATVAVVLIVVFTAICVIDYQQSVGRVNAALDAALMHAGGMSMGGGDAGNGTGTNAGASNTTAGGNGAGNASDRTDGGPFADGGREAGQQGALPPEIGGKRGGSDPVIPVATYAVNDDGTLTAMDERTTASIAESVLAQAATALANVPDGSGTLDNLGLFYQKRTANGTTYLAFADMSAASSWQQLALTLAGVGLLALAAFFVVSVFFSRWALRPVAHAWDQQRRFVADASHDLKTPLTVILANTSILMEHPERSVASQSQWVESTQHEAECMQELVGDLLLLAQVDEGGNARRDFARVDLSDLVEGELLQFESVAFERGITLDGSIETDLTTQGDETRLRRLTSTLLDNACKYANDGGSVRVTLRRADKRLELSVHNTGPAISPDDLPHVFDRFFRADKARTGSESGSGLGLAIAHGIAEEHGGTLTATSSEDRGTTFTASLPAIDRVY